MLPGFTSSSIVVTLLNGPAAPEVKLLPKHKKNAEVGEKKTVYSSKILVDQEDAVSFEDQEEVSTILISRSNNA
jgi:glutamyl-tRNA synthetase